MHAAIEQFKRGQPFWWVVGGTVVVPVWVVEHVTKRERILESSANSTAYRADHGRLLQAGPGSTGFARLLQPPGADAVPAAEFLDIGFELHGKSPKVIPKR
jgi:hypothetical protein